MSWLLADYVAVAFELALLLGLVSDCIIPSRNEKNTSTAYPTRNAMARGEMEAPSVMEKLPNSPTTAPPMPAIRKRAQFAREEGVNVRVLSSSSKDRSR
jgi:hypothetical protein